MCKQPESYLLAERKTKRIGKWKVGVVVGVVVEDVEEGNSWIGKGVARVCGSQVEESSGAGREILRKGSRRRQDGCCSWNCCRYCRRRDHLQTQKDFFRDIQTLFLF
jgi:hypothetical protein